MLPYLPPSGKKILPSIWELGGQLSMVSYQWPPRKPGIESSKLVYTMPTPLGCIPRFRKGAWHLVAIRYPEDARVAKFFQRPPATLLQCSSLRFSVTTFFRIKFSAKRIMFSLNLLKSPINWLVTRLDYICRYFYMFTIRHRLIFLQGL
jgi:hypothetical protein